MTTTDNLVPKRPHIFISHAAADKDIAREVATELQASGVGAWLDSWEFTSGDSIAQRIREDLASSDFLLVLLSARSVSSHWVQAELSTGLSKELRDRAITVIPALIDDCEIPSALTDRFLLDLRHDLRAAVHRLAQQIALTPDLQFSTLSRDRFEELIVDLLTKLGFAVRRTSMALDTGVDLVASYRSRDPFGVDRTETWVVQTKLYREQRVSVSALRQLMGYLMLSGSSKKGLIVTNSGLTSVARDFLEDSSEKAGRELRVIDGSELTNLLTQHPDLVQKYFASGENK